MRFVLNKTPLGGADAPSVRSSPVFVLGKQGLNAGPRLDFVPLAAAGAVSHTGTTEVLSEPTLNAYAYKAGWHLQGGFTHLSSSTPLAASGRVRSLSNPLLVDVGFRARGTVRATGIPSVSPSRYLFPAGVARQAGAAHPASVPALRASSTNRATGICDFFGISVKDTLHVTGAANVLAFPSLTVHGVSKQRHSTHLVSAVPLSASSTFTATGICDFFGFKSSGVIRATGGAAVLSLVHLSADSPRKQTGIVSPTSLPSPNAAGVNKSLGGCDLSKFMAFGRIAATGTADVKAAPTLRIAHTNRQVGTWHPVSTPAPLHATGKPRAGGTLSLSIVRNPAVELTVNVGYAAPPAPSPGSPGNTFVELTVVVQGPATASVGLRVNVAPGMANRLGRYLEAA